MNIVIAIIIFSAIIIIHELGHFLLAKKNGIAVLEFSLGLGPTLIGFTKGETKYSLKLLPFGGSCMMLGEDGVSDDNKAFPNKSVLARIMVVAAGPAFNFILAFLLSVVVVAANGYAKPIISGVIENFPAAEAGLESGDEILKVNGESIGTYKDVSLYSMLLTKDTKTTITYQRDGEVNKVTLVPKYDEESGRYLIGLLSPEKMTKGNVLEILENSFYEVRYWVKLTVKSLEMLIQGQVKADQLSGPVGIVGMIGTTYSETKTEGILVMITSMLNISIFLSANLGVMNLLPIPALDGGRLVFLIIEGIRKKKIDPEKEGMVHFIGIVLLLALMAFVMFNDIRKLF